MDWIFYSQAPVSCTEELHYPLLFFKPPLTCCRVVFNSDTHPPNGFSIVLLQSASPFPPLRSCSTIILCNITERSHLLMTHTASSIPPVLSCSFMNGSWCLVGYLTCICIWLDLGARRLTINKSLLNNCGKWINAGKDIHCSNFGKNQWKCKQCMFSLSYKTTEAKK